MARKQHYLKPTAFEPKGSIFEGVEWHIANSKGTDTYSVRCEPKGFTCECSGFVFRGRCKHSQQVLKQVEEAVNGQAPEYAW